jgi:hypothetical protein
MRYGSRASVPPRNPRTRVPSLGRLRRIAPQSDALCCGVDPLRSFAGFDAAAALDEPGGPPPGFRLSRPFADCEGPPGPATRPTGETALPWTVFPAAGGRLARTVVRVARAGAMPWGGSTTHCRCRTRLTARALAPVHPRPLRRRRRRYMARPAMLRIAKDRARRHCRHTGSPAQRG